MFQRITGLAAVIVIFVASSSVAQDLIGIEQSGNVIRIDKNTGTAASIGPSGFVATNSAASDSSGRIFTIIGIPGRLGQLIQIDPTTGGGSVFLELPACRAEPMDVRGIAFDSNDILYVVIDPSDSSAEDVLVTIDMTTGVCSEIGPTGLTGIQGLAFDPGDNLFCLNVAFPSGLCRINVTTGVATVIGGGASFQDFQALEFDEDGVLYAARSNLLRLNPINGDATLVGATGFVDIRGLAFTTAPPIRVVEIDIKPGGEPNCFNNDGNGNITVAILGSADFDAAQVDPATVALEGLSVAMIGNGTKLQAHIKDINLDDFNDLVVQIEDMVGAFEPGEGTAVLTGELFDGTPFEGSDSICVVQ